VLADVGETAQFLATKAVVLNNEARNQFLDFLYHDLGEALRRLIRQFEGDYSADTYRTQFPKYEGADTRLRGLLESEKSLKNARGPRLGSCRRPRR